MSDFLCRIYVEASLSLKTLVVLDEKDHHYLRNVLRAKKGSNLRVFNGRDGEWSASYHEKNIEIETLLREQISPPPIDLYFAPIRQNRMDILIEKCTEIGLENFYPVFTEYTQVRNVNIDRLQKQVKEASEQSESLNCPKIHPPQILRTLLKSKTDLYVADERRDAQHFLNQSLETKRLSILVGPEGGFSKAEREYFETLKKYSLGPSILRAETAAILSVAYGNILFGK